MNNNEEGEVDRETDQPLLAGPEVEKPAEIRAPIE